MDVLEGGDVAGARSSSQPARTPAVVNFATPLSGVASVAAGRHEHEASLDRTPEGSIGSAATGNSAGGWTAGVMRTPAMRSLRSARRWVQQWSAAPAVVQDAELVLPSVAEATGAEEEPGADTADRAGQSTGGAGPDGSEAQQRAVPGTAIRRAARSLAALAPIALPALRLQMLKRLLSARKKQAGQ